MKKKNCFCIFFFNIFFFIYLLTTVNAKATAAKIENQQLISLDCDNIELRDLLLQLNDITKYNLILPQALTGKITIICPEKVPITIVPKVIETVLKLNNFGIVESDSFYTIVPLSTARLAETGGALLKFDEQPSDAKQYIKIQRVKNINANNIVNQLRQIIPNNEAKIFAEPTTNSIILACAGDLLKKYSELINALDIDELQTSVYIYQIKYNNAQTLAAKIQQVISSLNAQKGLIISAIIIPEEQSNKLLVISAKTNIKNIEDLINQLDNAADTTTIVKVYCFENISVKNAAVNLTNIIKSNAALNNLLRITFIYEDLEQNALIVSSSSSEIHNFITDYIKLIDTKSKYRKPSIKVFSLKYADAEIVVNNIKKLLPLTDPVYNEKFKLTNIISDNRQQTIIISSNYDEIIEHIGEMIKEFDKETNIQKSNIHIYKLQNANAQTVAEVLAKLTFPDAKTNANAAVPVTFDKSTNSVVLTCSNEQFVQIKKIIEDFDTEKPQVLINVWIAEVSADDLDKLGVEWMFGQNISDNRYGIGASQNFNMIDPNLLKQTGGIKNAAKLLPGFSIGVINSKNSDIGAIINLFKQTTNFNILSSPKILTEDNNEAFINIGQKVPFITNSRVTDNNATIYSYQYQDVGITLKITPHVSANDNITLDISQEVKNLLEKVVFDAPLVSTRELKTKITVENKKTIVIGGLISSTKTKVKYSTPFLSKIPIFGELFKSSEEKENKTNLMIIISPEIIKKNNLTSVQLQESKLQEYQQLIDNTEKKLKTDNTGVEKNKK